MLNDILKQERGAAGAKLTGICPVFTSTIAAARALDSGQAVAVVPDPSFTMRSMDIADVDVDIYLVYPQLDEDAARDYFTEAFFALLPFEKAVPQMVDVGDQQFFAYRITFTNTYNL